ncbi:carbohydrate-binding domain-containing protein, partial [Streptococcus pluranimalium]
MTVKLQKTKKVATIGLASLLLLAACGTRSNADQQSSYSSSTATKSSQGSSAVSSDYISNEDKQTAYDETSSSKITLNGSSAEISGSGAVINENTITISKAGTYIVTGESDNLQILVDTADTDDVHIVLDGVTMTDDQADINAQNANKVYVTLAEGSKNTISDSSHNTAEDADAAIFSAIDVTINGSGQLS